MPCNKASSLTRDNAKGDDRSVWTSGGLTHDGLLSLTYCGVFKDGATTVSRLAINDLKEIPSGFEPLLKQADMIGEKVQVRDLPMGFSGYKDMAFEIRTDAIPNDQYLTLRVPSVQSQEEFEALAVLYLDEDPMLPGVLQWDSSYRELDIPEADFKTRSFSAPFDFSSAFHARTYIGRVIVAKFNQAEYDKSAVDLYIRSVVGPPYVKVGETFTYSVTVYNGGGTGVAANEVVFNSNMAGASFISVSSTQGRCHRSVNSSDVVVCQFGTVASLTAVVVNVTVKADDSPLMQRSGEEVFVTSNTVSCREKDYTPENNAYDSRSTVIRR